MDIEFKPKNSSTIAEERKKESYIVINKTNLAFVAAHNGYRPATMLVVLGLSGGGKSTTKRSQVVDYYKNKKPHERAGIWYSEESEKDFEIHYVRTALGEKFFDDKNVNFYSEIDNFKSKKDAFLKLDKMFQVSDIVFFDNLTTSRLCSGTYQEQEKFIYALKNLVKKHEKPLVLYAHTNAGIKEGGKALIEMNDVRGSKEIINQAEFVYILQQFHVGSEIFSTLRIVKNRGQEVKTKLFHLKYNSRIGVYDECLELPWVEFKSFFDMRNKL